MKNVFIVTLLLTLTIACGKSGGGNTNANNAPGTYVPGTNPGTPGEPVIEFAVNMNICSKGALNVAQGTKMSRSSAQAYFYEYLVNADRMRRELGYLVVTEYDRYDGRPIERRLEAVTGIDIATGSNHGYN